MSTVSEIVADARSQINQPDVTNSDFTAAEMLEYLNKAIRFAATKILYPRKSGTVTPVLNTKEHSFPSDFMHLVTSGQYYGDNSVAGGLTRLRILTLDQMNTISPDWMENTTVNTGVPKYLILLNRTQFSLFPAPDANAVSSGNLVRLTYAYYPAAISSDSATPELPTVVHDLLSIYMAHLCYGSKLNNSKTSTEKLNEFLSKLKMVELPSTQETFEWSFSFGDADRPYTDNF